MSEWKWLKSTKELQEETYLYDFDAMTDAHITQREQGVAAPSALTRFIDWNQTAAVQELAEAREEFAWKPWATDPVFIRVERLRDEIIDVLHFLGNILVAIDVTDEELEVAYQKKQDINRQRQASGKYSAQKGGLSEGSDAT